MQIIHASQNNLKNISLTIPENQLIVVTGLSGSGKSSLAMEVIGNEGMRYFLESLLAYTAQNGLTIPTANVDEIKALPPVIKVAQSKRFWSVNATFGTLSELSTVFRILFARYAADEVITKSLFSFNHPKGACETCRGIGEQEFIDVNKLIADATKTIREGAIATTLPNRYTVYSQVTVEELNKVCQVHGFSVDIPWKDLTAAQKEVVLNGSERIKIFYGKHSLASRLKWKGLKAKPREKGFYKGMLPIMEDILRRDRNKNILRFASSRVCPDCHGARIKATHLQFRWKGLNFYEWMQLSLKEILEHLQTEKFKEGEKVLVEKMTTKLADLIHLGMGDYSLYTPSAELSSGDAQRIKLINRVNSKLQGLLYIFDEPSIGLSTEYQKYLLRILKRLIHRGNTVMVVEHDLDFIQHADWIVELGPKAGDEGGKIVFSGTLADFEKQNGLESPTQSALAEAKKKVKNKATVLSKVNFELKPQQLMVIERETPEIRHKIEKSVEEEGLKALLVDDQPIGKTLRSNPATYTGLANKIRNIFAKTEEAKGLKLTKSAFSFNSRVGRCETCQGAGVIRYKMSTFGTVNQTCPTCNGKRFKAEVLQAHWSGKNISEIYQLSVKEATDFFANEKKIKVILDLMVQLGLGYLQLGQPSNTLSGGEAQRIKLTKHFAKKSTDTVLVLQEPSIGLHYENLKQLIAALHQLKKQTAGIICFDNHDLFQKEADFSVKNAVSETFSIEKTEKAAPRKEIRIRGAKTHSLQNINVDFPKNKFSVVTGISGAGKTSLVIDTLHGFGWTEMTKQFSGYQQSRVGVNFQFDVESIQGLTPTICITRKQQNYSKRTDVAQQIGMDKILRFAYSRKAQAMGKEWSASHFSTRHQLGQCPVCEGVGEERIPDKSKIILEADKSIADGLLTHNKALKYYGNPDGQYMAILQEVGKKYGFDLQTPFSKYSAQQNAIFWKGTGEKRWKTTWHYRVKTQSGTQAIEMPWKGILNYLQEEYFKTRKNKNIKKLTALFSYRPCSTCSGSGLNPERLEIKIANQSLADLKRLNLTDFESWLKENTKQSDVDAQFLKRIQTFGEPVFLRAKQLHIDHLQLNRKSQTLSGGEKQRVELIKQLNSPLKGMTYVLDEPSAGLSQNNVGDLLQIIRDIIAKGNTVIAIEYTKELILAADKIVQLGPLAGKKGGKILFDGSVKQFLNRKETHSFLKENPSSFQIQAGEQNIVISDVHKYNLQRKKMEIPTGGITAITGPSGVGKTTLVKEILMPSFEAKKPVNCAHIDWSKNYEGIHYFEPRKLRSYRSTLLVDYLQFLPKITKTFAKNGPLKSRDFSYKSKKSQCPNCKGKGCIETALDIVSNVIETCEVCRGTRYKPEILEYRVDSKNIAEVLAMDVTELENWLRWGRSKGEWPFALTIRSLQNIGLGHLQLDQPVQSLSSGEKQRLLLMDWLPFGRADGHSPLLFILDEPGIGLFYADIDLLFGILEGLSQDNDVLVITHNEYLLRKIGVGVEI